MAAIKFGDSSSELDGCNAVDIAPAAKQTASTSTSAVQTEDIVTHDQSVNVLDRKNEEVQTDSQEQTGFADLSQAEKQNLASFLRRVEDALIAELDINAASRAFDGYAPSADEQGVSKRIMQLRFKPQDRNIAASSALSDLDVGPADKEAVLGVTDLSWSPSGGMLCACFGRVDSDIVASPSGYLCGWNTGQSSVKEDQPDVMVELPAYGTCMSFHPSLPGLIAVGLHSGDIVVVDLNQRQGSEVVATTGQTADSHAEPVAQVLWSTYIDRSRKLRNKVVSVASDGFVLVWLWSGNSLNLATRIRLTQGCIPKFLRASSSLTHLELGMSCACVSPHDSEVMFVGCESGHLLKFRLEALGHHAVIGAGLEGDDGAVLETPAPPAVSFEKHAAFVSRVSWSAEHRALALSSGADGRICLWHEMQASPLLTVTHPENKVFTSAAFSLAGDAVVAASSIDGGIYLYDLESKTQQPLAVLTDRKETPSKPPALLSVCFNPQRHRLVAGGDESGIIHVWQLGPEALPKNNATSLAELVQTWISDDGSSGTEPVAASAN